LGKNHDTELIVHCIFSILLYNVNVHVVEGGLTTSSYYSNDIEAALQAVDDLSTALCYIISRVF
jgi:hypothetical protein